MINVIIVAIIYVFLGAGAFRLPTRATSGRGDSGTSLWVVRRSDGNELSWQALWNTNTDMSSNDAKEKIQKDDLERLFRRFARDTLLIVDYEAGKEAFTFAEIDDVYRFDPLKSSRLHSETVFTLIRSDVQNRKEDEGELGLVQEKKFPSTYRRAIHFLSDVIKTTKKHPELSELNSVIKFICRKEGLRLSTQDIPDSMSVREIVEIKRKIERSLSLVMLLCITYRAVRENERAKRDFMYFAKGMAERIPVQDKHFALVLFCRGILHPSYHTASNIDNSNTPTFGSLDKVDAQSVTRTPLVGLQESFVRGMKSVGVMQPSMTSRLLFPFAATALRCYHVVADNQPFVGTSVGDDGDLFGTRIGESPGRGASTGDVQVKAFQSVSADMYSTDETRLFALFRDCKEIDDAARRYNGLEECGSELLSSMRRWMVDLTAVYFINDVDLQLKAEKLPEELRRNTVAMELLATSSTFVVGRKKHRVGYMAHMATLGKKVQVAIAAFEEWQFSNSKESSGHKNNDHKEQDVDLSDAWWGIPGPGDGDDIDRMTPPTDPRPARPSVYATMQAEELSGISSASKFHPIANVKKFMTIVNALEYLVPANDPLFRQFDQHFKLSILGDGSTGIGATKQLNNARIRAILEETVEAKMLKMHNKMSLLASMQADLHKADANGYQYSNEGTASSRETRRRTRDLWGRIDVDSARGSSDGWIRAYHSAALRDRAAFAYFDNPSVDPGKGRGDGGSESVSAVKYGAHQGQDEDFYDDSDGSFWSSILRFGRRSRTRGRKEKKIAGDREDTANDAMYDNSAPTKGTYMHIGDALQLYLLRVIAPILGVDMKTLVGNADVTMEIAYVYTRWRSPHLLFDYYRIHNMSFTSEILGLYRRFLRALLGVSSETIEQIRLCDPDNRRHLSRFPPEIMQPWIEGHTKEGVVLPGYSDAQTLFMLGEDALSCMMVKPRQRSTNRGLLSFLLHGNIRVVGSKDSAGRLRTRSVVKLLIDEETRRPVLYAETPVHNGRGIKEEAVLDVYDQVSELGRLLGLTVIYATAPNESNYHRRNYEIDSTRFTNRDDLIADTPEAGDNTSVQSGENLAEAGGSNTKAKNELTYQGISNVQKGDFNRLIDYSSLAMWVWVDGIKNPGSGRYIDGMTPMLLRRDDVTIKRNHNDGDTQEYSGKHYDDIDANSRYGTNTEAGLAEIIADKGYYANGFRLPHSLEEVYAQRPCDKIFLPDFTCGRDKASKVLDSLGWTPPADCGELLIGDGGKNRGSSGKRRSVSQQAMLALRQRKINEMNGRTDRVEKEQASAKEDTDSAAVRQELTWTQDKQMNALNDRQDMTRASVDGINEKILDNDRDLGSVLDMEEGVVPEEEDDDTEDLW